GERAIETPPARATVPGRVDGRLAADGGARPHGLAVHRQHPGGVGIPGVHHDRKSDVADLLRHRRADRLTATHGAIEPVDAIVVLLIEPVGFRLVLHHAVRIVAKGYIGLGQDVRRYALIQRRPA